MKHCNCETDRLCEGCLDKQFHKKSHTQQIAIAVLSAIVIGFIIYLSKWH